MPQLRFPPRAQGGAHSLDGPIIAFFLAVNYSGWYTRQTEPIKAPHPHFPHHTLPNDSGFWDFFQLMLTGALALGCKAMSILGGQSSLELRLQLEKRKITNKQKHGKRKKSNLLRTCLLVLISLEAAPPCCLLVYTHPSFD